MKLATVLQELNDRPNPPACPDYIIYTPPSGAAVECPAGMDLVQCAKAARQIASRNPGRRVAVYGLLGFTIAPIVEPEFTPAAPSDDPMYAEIEDGMTA